MDIELEVLLAAIVEQEGGSYTLRFTAFEKVADKGEEMALAMEPTDGGTAITFTLVPVSEINLEEEDA